MSRLLTREDRALVEKARAILARNRKEAKAERAKRVVPTAKGQRNVRERDPAFLAYVRRQPCEAAHLGGCEGPVEAAHVRYSDASRGIVNPGLQRKNHDRHANPLCRFHHQCDQHARRERDFWAGLGKDAYDTAAAHYAAFAGSQHLSEPHEGPQARVNPNNPHDQGLSPLPQSRGKQS